MAVNDKIAKIKNTAFKAYGDVYTNNNATSLFSERFIWIIENYMPNCVSKNILEIGCGDGGVIQFLKTTAKIYGLDASESGIQQCKNKGLDVKLYDASNDAIPFDDNFFDYIICLETLEHLENPQHCFEEVKRCLKPSGSFIISIPNPRTLHEFIYPGLFEFPNFVKYLSLNFKIKKFLAWGYIPFIRESKIKLLTNFYLNHGFQYIMRQMFGHRATYFWAWCWTFELTKMENNLNAIEKIAKSVS
jgi:SAM-dependent methyltransferase